jgi:hypothetical protein
MKKLLFLSTLLSLFAFAFTPYNNTEKDWIELINGKDFTGWKVATENSATWTVENGLFQAVGKRSHLFYVGEHLNDGFKNFEIEVQVKTFKLANSGIYFHTQYQESGWPSKGIEIQVNNSHLGEGDYMEYKRMASLYGVRNIYKSVAKDDEWMTVKARVESDHVQIWVNGIKTVDYVQPERTFRVPKLAKGTFALQGHDALSKMQYKSFKVKRLPDDVHSNTKATTFGAWHDSLVVYQGRQFAFIDLNPKTNLSPKELADYVYSTGINVAWVKEPKRATDLAAAKDFPLFTGIKVNAKNQGKAQVANADFIIGESTNLKTAKALLSAKNIHIWSDKGNTLSTPDASMLLDLAKLNNIAIEIDNDTKTPSVDVIKMAKEKGCKFTFAGLIPLSKMEKSQYILEAIKGAKLVYKDQYVPKY